MLPILRKIRRDLFSGGKLKRYFLYSLGEILLVVLGILIALQVDNWNDRRLERQESISVYQSVRQQISEDRIKLLEVKEYNLVRSRAYERANQIISAAETAKTDSLALFAMLLAQYSDFHRNASIYEGLALSGRLKLIENPDITSGLQNLDMTYNFINNLESMHWDIIITELSQELRSVVNYNTRTAVLPERLFGVELQNIFVESIYMTKYKDAIYGQALAQIDSLNLLIDGEVNTQ
jgi:hypothetical protein